MVGRYAPPTERLGKKMVAAKITPNGLLMASRATGIPLNPMPGSSVDTCGFHSAAPDRKYKPAPIPANAPEIIMERTILRLSLIPAYFACIPLLKPQAFNSYPNVVLFRIIYMIIAIRIAIKIAIVAKLVLKMLFKPISGIREDGKRLNL